MCKYLLSHRSIPTYKIKLTHTYFQMRNVYALYLKMIKFYHRSHSI